jgi:hypothetical protein
MLKNIFLKHGDILRKSLMLSLLVWMPISVYSQAIITTLGSSFPMLNGSDLSAWTQNGNSSWQINNKELHITQGNGMLVSRISVSDIQMEFDYWVSSDAHVSVFFRCMNSSVINSDTAYEVLLVNQKGSLGAGVIPPFLT